MSGLDFQSLMQLYNVSSWITWAGYFGMGLILFSETGLFFGFLLPGESLLVTAGIFAATGQLNLLYLALIFFPAAVLGDSVGYLFGNKVGLNFYKKEDSFFFRKEHLKAAQEFYSVQGGRAILLARFIPIIRTFAPVAAGIATMPYRKFFIYNVIGAFGWVVSGLLLGYFLGKSIPNVQNYAVLIVVIVVVLSLIPTIYSYLKHSKK